MFTAQGNENSFLTTHLVHVIQHRNHCGLGLHLKQVYSKGEKPQTNKTVIARKMWSSVQNMYLRHSASGIYLYI